MKRGMSMRRSERCLAVVSLTLAACACALLVLDHADALTTQLPIDAGDAGDGGVACVADVSGAVTANRSCVVAQEYEAQSLDGSPPALSITVPAPMPAMSARLHVDGTPMRGRVPAGSLRASISVYDGESRWTALKWSGYTRGTINVVLTSVKLVKVKGQDAYELHGTLDAQLAPETHSATGDVDVHVAF
jgi:hypothetical protein